MVIGLTRGEAGLYNKEGRKEKACVERLICSEISEKGKYKSLGMFCGLNH